MKKPILFLIFTTIFCGCKKSSDDAVEIQLDGENLGSAVEHAVTPGSNLEDLPDNIRKFFVEWDANYLPTIGTSRFSKSVASVPVITEVKGIDLIPVVEPMEVTDVDRLNGITERYSARYISPGIPENYISADEALTRAFLLPSLTREEGFWTDWTKGVNFNDISPRIILEIRDGDLKWKGNNVGRNYEPLTEQDLEFLNEHMNNNRDR